MADFPDYVDILFDGYSERFDPAVEIVEMERGPPKMSVLNSQVRKTISVSLLFRSKTDIASFESWYFNTIRRVGAFNMTHPRTGATITARFSNADIGELVPLTTGFRIAKRDCAIEYME